MNTSNWHPPEVKFRVHVNRHLPGDVASTSRVTIMDTDEYRLVMVGGKCGQAPRSLLRLRDQSV